MRMGAGSTVFDQSTTLGAVGDPAQTDVVDDQRQAPDASTSQRATPAVEAADVAEKLIVDPRTLIIRDASPNAEFALAGDGGGLSGRRLLAVLPGLASAIATLARPVDRVCGGVHPRSSVVETCWAPSPDGTERPVIAQLTLDLSGDRASLIIKLRAIAMDATAPPGLDGRQKLQNALLEASDSGVLSLQAVRNEAGEVDDFTILFANAAAGALTGRDAIALLGRRLSAEFAHARSSGIVDAYAAALDEPQRFEVEYRVDGVDNWFRVSAKKLHEDNVVVTFTPISELKSVQADLTAQNEKLARANDALESFHATVAHDLRSPIGRILRLAEMLESTDAAALPATVARIRDAARQADDVVVALSELARLGERHLTKEPVVIDDVVTPIITRLRMEHGEAVESVNVEPGLQVLGDPALLTRLFENLLGNAVKYRGKGPARIKIYSAPSKKPSHIVLRIADDGVGVPDSHHDAIFDMFVRTPDAAASADGRGVGLALSRRIADVHDGGLRFAEQRTARDFERGAVFELELINADRSGGRPPRIISD